MSGDGNHRSSKLSSDHLTAQLRKKLASALMPVTQNMEANPVQVDLTPPVYLKPLRVPCVVQETSYSAAPPLLHNPLDEWYEASTILNEMVLLEETLEFNHVDCDFNAVIQYETPIAATKIESYTVLFDDVKKVKLRNRELKLKGAVGAKQNAWPVVEFKTTQQSVDIPEAQKIRTRDKKVGGFRNKQTKMPGKYWALPIKKKAISPLKINRELREEMREALAKKANTSGNNIQIRVIYERMDMASVATIDQDDDGNLLCFPKPDAIKKAKNGSVNHKQMDYLIFGMRMDTQEVVKALMPMPESSFTEEVSP